MVEIIVTAGSIIGGWTFGGVVLYVGTWVATRGGRRHDRIG